MLVVCTPYRYVGVTAAVFKDKEDIPAMSVAALEKKYHCIIEVEDKSKPTSATARTDRQASVFKIIFWEIPWN